MIRKTLLATSFAVALCGAPAAAAEPGPMYWDDPGHYATDVPGMNYDAHLTGPCTNMDRFTFGRGPGGEALQCRWIPNQWPPIYTGFWQTSYELVGVRDIGSPCPKPQSAAQAPDGRPLICMGAQGWQAGKYNGVGFTPM
ncbi:hypothetical protein [Mycolicibacterium parafortuitum]|uniref:Secreted protein n=1 Tax=Mycolicibacterium parafortuitum TaxID=39692 RepID=A0A375YKD3_MYCPF|nr:hypothetical protein [Mycolicibacterium parafortuitum]ORB26659.1 hypothetical protein BST38_25730 [Mycolicibacterium parafortuitum]SRX81595.1 hypothetical protein MPP7335_03347 [Mycolicibacterium parafortuitum]